MPNPDYYFQNENGRFKEMADSMGVADRGIGRGSVVFDYDRDGDPDLLVVNQKPIQAGFGDAGGTILYRNDMPGKGNWLQVQLSGTDTDINGIGSKVEIVAGDTRMIREIDGGSSHQSQNSVIAHFGLGDARKVDSVNIYWLGGGKQTILNQQVNQVLVMKEVPENKWKWYYTVAIIFIAVAVITAVAVKKHNKS
jgi:hypothetical protein